MRPRMTRPRPRGARICSQNQDDPLLMVSYGLCCWSRACNACRPAAIDRHRVAPGGGDRSLTGGDQSLTGGNMSDTLTAPEAAKRLGVGATTLKTWAEKVGVGEKNGAGVWLFSDRDMNVLEVVQALRDGGRTFVTITRRLR